MVSDASLSVLHLLFIAKAYAVELTHTGILAEQINYLLAFHLKHYLRVLVVILHYLSVRSVVELVALHCYDLNGALPEDQAIH
jgi:hypothetical protein